MFPAAALSSAAEKELSHSMDAAGLAAEFAGREAETAGLAACRVKSPRTSKAAVIRPIRSSLSC